jgi:hypothetical protein
MLRKPQGDAVGRAQGRIRAEVMPRRDTSRKSRIVGPRARRTRANQSDVCTVTLAGRTEGAQPVRGQ